VERIVWGAHAEPHAGGRADKHAVRGLGKGHVVPGPPRAREAAEGDRVRAGRRGTARGKQAVRIAAPRRGRHNGALLKVKGYGRDGSVAGRREPAAQRRAHNGKERVGSAQRHREVRGRGLRGAVRSIWRVR
jgi:hypothetical protein